MQRALFLDRDGVINVDHGYVGRPEDFEIIPGIISVLRAARKRGFLLIVVTNQSGIARGYFSAEAYQAVEGYMCRRLAEYGVELTAVYHCPHHPEGVVPGVSMECSCRKPAPGLIEQAALDHHIDVTRSILVGDKETDIQAGRAAGVGRTIVISPGQDNYADLLAALEEM